MGWYSKYRGQCAGRILHFLYHYCGLHVAERAIVGFNEVHLYGEPLAKVTWEPAKDDLRQIDVPVFKFAGKYEQLYAKDQMRKRDEAEKNSGPLTAEDRTYKTDFDFTKAKLLAAPIAFHASRIEDHSGSARKGFRMAVPDATWTISEIRAVAAHTLLLCKEFGIDPLNPHELDIETRQATEELRKEVVITNLEVKKTEGKQS